MRVNKFHVFVHGPFASNVYADVKQLEEYISDGSVRSFRERIKADPDINRYQQQLLHFCKYKEDSFFGKDDLPVLLAEIPIDDFSRFLSNSNIEIAKLEFNKNIIYLYAAGVGIFSSKVTVTIYENMDMNSIKEKLEEEINNAIHDKFKENEDILKVKKILSSPDHRYFKLINDGTMDINPSKIGKLAWLHKIYWFSGNEFFTKDSDDMTILRACVRKDFTELLEQDLETTTAFLDHYVFYGWGRSLIVTRNNCCTSRHG